MKLDAATRRTLREQVNEGRRQQLAAKGDPHFKNQPAYRAWQRQRRGTR